MSSRTASTEVVCWYEAASMGASGPLVPSMLWLKLGVFRCWRIKFKRGSISQMHMAVPPVSRGGVRKDGRVPSVSGFVGVVAVSQGYGAHR